MSNTLIGKDKILMTIGELMSNKLETIEASDLVQVAAKKMRDKKISSLVVIDNSNKPVGIITERDFVRKVCVEDSDDKKMKVQDIMSDALVTTDAISDVEVAADIMLQNNVRHLLVVEGDNINKPLGIITPTDFTRYLKENLNMDAVKAKILESLKQTDAESDKYE
ncbi:MAG: CBS domain-containing protein [Thermoproteota archaeon]|nr:CBS domain-containing protein [Thermoproteota archaeon]